MGGLIMKKVVFENCTGLSFADVESKVKALLGDVVICMVMDNGKDTEVYYG